MYTKIGKLITGRINNSTLYEFALNLIAMLMAKIGQNEKIAEYITAVEEAIGLFELASMKNSKNPYTAELKEKHKKRITLYTSLRRQIGGAQTMIDNPGMVAAANQLKQVMLACGLWDSNNLSYRDATQVIRLILQKLADESCAQWVTEASLQAVLESLRAAEKEYEVVLCNRQLAVNENMSPLQIVTRKALTEYILSLLTVLNFGALRNQEIFLAVANDVADMITRANAITKAQQTRADSEEPGNPEEPIPEAETGSRENGSAVTTDFEDVSIPDTNDASKISGHEESNSGIRPGEDTCVGQT